MKGVDYMQPMETAKQIAKTLDEKKALDIKCIHVTDITVIADYIIIASATSNTQAKALSEYIEFDLENKGVKVSRIDGFSDSGWIVMDYSSVLVNIFYSGAREVYTLEKLWADGEVVDLLD